MQVIERGVLYALSDFTGSGVQLVRFTVKRPTGKFDNGTTIEELLEVARHKLNEFENRSSSMYNQMALIGIEQAIEAMKRRLSAKLETKYANVPDTSK